MEIAELKQGEVMQIIDPTHYIGWKHACLIGKLNDEYVLIDTQLSGRYETIYVGKKQIKKYLDEEFQGLTEFKFDIFLVKGSLIEQFFLLNIDEEGMWKTNGVPDLMIPTKFIDK